MKISHEEYLKRTLSSKQMELENLRVEHRINIVVFETKNTLINKEIDSLEQQLMSGKEV